ncbi:MAG: DUF3151 domain-containing protein [Actinobacteria bacterium]|nr:DUF3151 domain-containing protein [Actinomycetota bacterium]
MEAKNLLDGPEPTLLPDDEAVTVALEDGADVYDIVRDHPESSLAWSLVAELARAQGRVIEGYAFARVGYHRGLDALRRNGWRGSGPVPYSHPGNVGFLRCLALLAQSAEDIGEQVEAERCRTFLADCGGLG